MKLSGNDRFWKIIRAIRKFRTTAFKLAFPALLIEDVIEGKKPHELDLFDGIQIIAIFGAVLIIGGALLRLWARGHFFKGKLFTTGPYAIVRHPLYLGSTLIMIGVLCILNDWLNWAIIIPMIILFQGAAILYEERQLEVRFGFKWLEYKKIVPTVIPSLGNLSFAIQSRWSWQSYYATTERTATILFFLLPLLLEMFEETMF